VLWTNRYNYNKKGKRFLTMLLGETGRSPMKLQGKKIIVLVEDLYQELEAWYPLLRMREEGAEVTIVGTEAGATYKSKGGYPITSDVASRDTDVNKYHGIIIPGGYAPDLMRRHPATVQLVKDGFEQGKVVAAICHAGWMLTSCPLSAGRSLRHLPRTLDVKTDSATRHGLCIRDLFLTTV
jgi:protease I